MARFLGGVLLGAIVGAILAGVPIGAVALVQAIQRVDAEGIADAVRATRRLHQSAGALACAGPDDYAAAARQQGWETAAVPLEDVPYWTVDEDRVGAVLEVMGMPLIPFAKDDTVLLYFDRAGCVMDG